MDYFMSLIEQTLEYQNWGFNRLSAGVIGVLVFSVFKLWGLYRQGNKLRDECKSKEGNALSVHWLGYMTGFILSSFVYGIHKGSFIMILMAPISIFFGVRILCYIYYIYGFTRNELRGLALYSLILPAIILLPWIEHTFLVFSIGTVFALSTQPLKMLKEKRSGNIEIRMLITSLMLSVFWGTYGFAIDSLAMMVLNPCAVVLTATTIVLRARYAPKIIET